MVDNLYVFDKVTNPCYSLKHFLIKTNFELSELKNDNPSSIENYAVFLHEYTHYLQAFTTVNGLSVLLSYLDKIVRMTLDIGENILTNTTTAREINIRYKDDFSFVSKKLIWKREPRKIPYTNTKPNYFVINIDNPIFKQKTDEVFIYNIYDGLFYHVSTTMLRENMAMMAYFSIRNIGQDAIMDYVKINPSPQNPYNCKYWLLFNYFLYKYPQIKNVVKFTYFFCELSLMQINTGSFIKKLLADIDALLGRKNYTYVNENIFFEELFRKNIETINNDVIIIEKLINIIDEYINDLIKNYEFFSTIQKILKIAKTGIEYKKSNCTIYREIMDMRWICMMSELFFSPVIIQPNKIVSTINISQDYVNHLGLLFGISIIMDMITSKEILVECPFFNDIPICYLISERTINICSNNPFKITLFTDGGCLFYNSCLTLGLLPSKELEQYIKGFKVNL